jgi:hypothetical protein
LDFIEAKAAAGWRHELLLDYRLALDQWPGQEQGREQQRQRDECIRRYVAGLIAHSAAPDSVPLPAVPAAERLWTDPEIQAECRRIIERSEARDKLKAFADFVGTRSHELEKCAELPGFFRQTALNYAPEGPVRAAAEVWRQSEKVLLLVKRFGLGERWNPLPACLRTLQGHSECVTSVSVTPDGRRAVSGSDDKTLRVWDLESGQCLRTLAGHSGVVTSVSVTPDGRRAVSGSYDGTLRVWDLESGQRVALFPAESPVSAVSTMTTAKRLAIGTGNGEVIVLQLIDAEDFKPAQPPFQSPGPYRPPPRPRNGR